MTESSFIGFCLKNKNKLEQKKRMGFGVLFSGLENQLWLHLHDTLRDADVTKDTAKGRGRRLILPGLSTCLHRNKRANSQPGFDCAAPQKRVSGHSGL